MFYRILFMQFSPQLLIALEFLVRLKFDDERVTKEDMKRAMDEQYGGEEEVIGQTNNMLMWLFVKT